MIEKVLTLQDISLPEFLGIRNENIKEIAKAYPTSKIVSRGEKIHLKGPEKELNEIDLLMNDLIVHFNKYGKLSPDKIKTILMKKGNGFDILPDDEIIVHGNKGLIVKAKTANQKKLVDASKNNDIVFAVGPAGTGKTYTAVALAVRALKENQVKKIVITRPAVEAGENLGFLPGDLKEKIDPYLMPVYDALSDMLASEKRKVYTENNTIEIAPLAYMRGRTLNDAFIILDEAQNTTPNQLKMFLTRMGPTSKIIITGDISQVDLPRNQQSGLKDAMLKLSDIPGIKFIQLDGTDVVRHPLVVKILKAYDENI